MILQLSTMYWERKAQPNSVEPDQQPQKAASNQGQNCLPLMQQFLDTSIGSSTDLFNFGGKYGKELTFSMLGANSGDGKIDFIFRFFPRK